MCGYRLPPSSPVNQTEAAQGQRDAVGLNAAGQPTNHVVSVSVELVRILVIFHMLLYWDLLCIYLWYLTRSGMK
jgi:hypothetical protein